MVRSLLAPLLVFLEKPLLVSLLMVLPLVLLLAFLLELLLVSPLLVSPLLVLPLKFRPRLLFRSRLDAMVTLALKPILARAKPQVV
jgi:uncharacterized membrane protein